MISDFKISLAQKEDMMDIFSLANDPVVRLNAFKQETIVLEDHIGWFNNKINSENCVYYIIRDLEDKLVAEVRFDKDLEKVDEYTITIHLTKEFRGKGYGSKLIDTTVGNLFKDYEAKIVYAYVKTTNQASLKCFLKAEFNIITEEIINNSNSYKLWRLK